MIVELEERNCIVKNSYYTNLQEKKSQQQKRGWIFDELIYFEIVFKIRDVNEGRFKVYINSAASR